MSEEIQMSAENAMHLARLWRADKMIGGDPHEVCLALLGEIERLWGSIWIRDGSLPLDGRKVIVMHKYVTSGAIVNLKGDRRWRTDVDGDLRLCGIDFVIAWMPFPPAPR